MTKRMKRLKWCKKLYGDDIYKVGKIYISENRRCFCIYRNTNGKKSIRYVRYARYKMGKRLGRLLRSNEHVHHGKEGTMCDKYRNLKKLNNRKHLAMSKSMLGRHHSKETKRKMSYIALHRSEEIRKKIMISRDMADYRRFKLRKVV